MIDTIVIKIKHPSFEVRHPEFFSPDLTIHTSNDIPRELLNRPQKLFKKYVQNPSTEDKSEGRYKPCLTVYRYYIERKLEYYLHIQFSAPKVLNSNNLEEISVTDFARMVDNLRCKLQTMGIAVEEEKLSTAEVTKMHLGKNIEVKLPMNLTDVIAEIKKAEMGKHMETTQRDYKNGGESLYLYNSSHNHIFYDKVKDLLKPKNVSADKDKTTAEKIIGETLEKAKRQILRFEVRFTNVAIVRKVVNKILHTSYPYITLGIVFDEELWKGCLLDEWHSVINRPANQLAFKTSVSPEDALNLLIARQTNKKSNAHTLNKVLISFGLYQIVNKLGAKVFKNKIERHWDKKTCNERLTQKMKDAVTELKDIPLSEHISMVEKALQEFKKFSLEQ